jgi:hypothetical protein
LKKRTLTIFNRIEKQREKLLLLYDSLSTEQLQYRREPDTWNLLQILRHLITAEKQSFLYIKRKAARYKSAPEAGASAWFRHLLLRVALMLPVKYKAPEIADVKESVPDYEQMKLEWNEIRNEMREFIQSGDEELFTKALYRHPRAGLLNINQALEFIETHISHHQKQIQRIIRHHSSS